MSIEKWIADLPIHNELNALEINTPIQTFKLYYINTICDQAKIEKLLITPLYSIHEQVEYIQSLCVSNEVTSTNELYSYLIRGKALIVCSVADYYFFDANQVLNDKPGDTTMETTILGSQIALSEEIKTNVNLIRHRYPSEGFRLEEFELGKVSRTKAMILYDLHLVNPMVLAELKRKLSKIKVGMVQATGQLEKLINNKKRSLFPTMMITERPDRVALNLSHGKIIVILDGTPFALILPAVFYDYMSAMDDLYLQYWVSKGLILLRYIALFIAITLPAIYISVISFNPEFFRVQLTLSIAGSRAAVPYPSYLEVIFMLFMIEALTEASIRLPKFIGGTATTVGGLILGQAAQQAGLVSSIMIIITAAVTISNFVVPINAMSFSIRALRYPLIVLSSLFGLVGVIVGLFCLICYLANLQSFGQPYLKLFIDEASTSLNSTPPKGIVE
ncbi:spore germination protein [Paenibacillus cremeus]|uniref:Spore germination protein n=1 Tax=Paenibacillus cremeus TaxID=2163881 RepID=A0A559JGH9_9BACL|nr:spore germination protein [Paenibacillus cremeus]TVX98976.1 spore germination protein [Paenibacillus cremeus]